MEPEKESIQAPSVSLNIMPFVNDECAWYKNADIVHLNKEMIILEIDV